MNNELNNVSIVFDIDDTICNNNNRDYANAIPHKKIINKINNLYDRGAKITLYTSRGMVSCNGDLEKIVAKNKNVLEDWLETNNVKYHQLIFGKPIADLYVDDKAMNVRDFEDQKFGKLNGRSGFAVTRIGNIVKKEMSDDNYKKLCDWYDDSKNIANSPNIISNLYNTIYMEYINGVNSYNCITEELLDKLIEQILSFKQYKKEKFDKTKHIQNLLKHKSDDEEWNNIVDDCLERINGLNLDEYASLCHGDFTLANIIVKDDKIYLLDSLYEKEASSYLLDFAKLKMSLDGYEAIFLDAPIIDIKYAELLTEKLKELNIYEEVLTLEYMYCIRLYNYNEDKEKVKRFVKERMKELE